MTRSRNPFNATKPAEWATMSTKARKRWNRMHWRPEQWKCDLALKREATRLRNRKEGSTRGAGLEALAEKLSRQNPGRVAEPELLIERDRKTSRYVWVVYDPVTQGDYCSGSSWSHALAKHAGEVARARVARQASKQNPPPRETVQVLLQYPALARAYGRASASKRLQIQRKLDQVATKAQTIRRGNPSHRLSAIARARKKASWYQERARTYRERAKWTTLSAEDRRRIEREELAEGFAVNPRRHRRRRSK